MQSDTRSRKTFSHYCFVSVVSLIYTVSLPPPPEENKMKKPLHVKRAQAAKDFIEQVQVEPARLLELIKKWRRLQAGSSSRKCHSSRH